MCPQFESGRSHQTNTLLFVGFLFGRTLSVTRTASRRSRQFGGMKSRTPGLLQGSRVAWLSGKEPSPLPRIIRLFVCLNLSLSLAFDLSITFRIASSKSIPSLLARHIKAYITSAISSSSSCRASVLFWAYSTYAKLPHHQAKSDRLQTVFLLSM